jgi:hypothetical protein
MIRGRHHSITPPGQPHTRLRLTDSHYSNHLIASSGHEIRQHCNNNRSALSTLTTSSVGLADAVNWQLEWCGFVD